MVVPMQDVVPDAQSMVRLAVRGIYAIAGVIWLGALAFVLYRYYQIRTLTPVEAEVLKAETESYTERTTSTDSDGFTTEAEFKGYIPVAWVRYQFNGKTYTAEARHDTVGRAQPSSLTASHTWAVSLCRGAARWCDPECLPATTPIDEERQRGRPTRTRRTPSLYLRRGSCSRP